MLQNYGRGMKKANNHKIIQFQVVRDATGDDVYALYDDGRLYRIAWEDGAFVRYEFAPIKDYA